MKLYPDQAHGKQLLIESIKRGNKRIGFAAPCSYGKTVIMSNLTQGALRKHKRIWIIVDSIELIDQTRETLESHGIESAVIQGIHEDTNYSRPVQVVTAQTITRRWNIFDQHPEWLPDLVLVDEFHIQYKAHKELIGMIPNAHVIGFSATPTSKGLGKVYQDLVVGSTVEKLLEAKRLSPIRAYACLTPNMKKVKKDASGDFAKGETEKKVNTTTIRGDLVSNWLRLANGRKTIVFCVNVRHSLDVLQAFTDNDIPARQIDGRTHKGVRKETIEEFKNSEFQVLISVGTIIKGFNVVDVGCIVDAAPTRSLSRHIQKIGRGMRLNTVYPDCIILDHGGNILRNGFPEEYSPVELCNGEKGKTKDAKPPEEPLPKACPICGVIKPTNTNKCPSCGHETQPPSNVEVESARLEEVKKKTPKTPAEKRNKAMTNDEKQEFYSCALKYCEVRNKTQGFAANLYKDYFGVWPNARDKIVADYVTDTVENFIKSRNIRYAKRRIK